ncbi:MAG TPA: VWA domain-containing protein [Candidatus Limnocylindria bacterium]|nr:VWA domain-containing protein [Candidatus Limnocylindria bacterium]
MEYVLRFAYPAVLYGLIPLVFLCAWLRWKFYKGVRYRYSLTGTLTKQRFAVSIFPKKVLFCLRFITLVVLAFLIAKPRLVDMRSMVQVEGIDIVLVLDVSGSMAHPHHGEDKRSRIDVAKTEAIRFVERRKNDAIGLVIFATDALSRCPLTVDKKMLRETISQVTLGLLDERATLLTKGMLAGINRLKHSTAKSKVMIVLTDGAPSEHDADPRIAIAAAQQLGIKIYTVGIGSDEPLYVNVPMFGMQQITNGLNKELLQTIATKTGGTFFEAKKAQDMRTIYETIDHLEKSALQAPVLNTYQDWFMPLLVLAIMIIFLELVLKSFVWFGL